MIKYFYQKTIKILWHKNCCLYSLKHLNCTLEKDILLLYLLCVLLIVLHFYTVQEDLRNAIKKFQKWWDFSVTTCPKKMTKDFDIFEELGKRPDSLGRGKRAKPC